MTPSAMMSGSVPAKETEVTDLLFACLWEELVLGF